MSDWIQLRSGRRFFPLDPDPADIVVEDIAYALAGEVRFGGHCCPRVSVAEHSVAVSRAVPKECALWGLLHDASEAYLRDLPRPVKNNPTMAAYRDAEARLMRAVAWRFSLPWPEPWQVKAADLQACESEKRACMNPQLPWSGRPDPLLGYEVVGYDRLTAEYEFLHRYEELTQ